MVSIGGGNDHRFNFGVRKHGVIIKKFLTGLVDSGHAIHEIACDIANGIEIGIACLLAGFKMGELRDGPAAKNPYFQPALLFLGQVPPQNLICSLLEQITSV